MEINKVYFVSAGPGESDLITIRGLEIIKEAEVIIYDYLVCKDILRYARDDAELICCDTLGKKRYLDGFSESQELINKVILQNVFKGKKVVRLKNGDVSIFSRISEEIETLIKNNIEFEIVPGITAASCASAFSGVPLTDRRFSSNIVFLTGHIAKNKNSEINWKAIAGCDTIVVYMGIKNISEIIKKLMKSGKAGETPVVCVSDAGRITQKIVTGHLENIENKIKNNNIQPPAIFIIGKVAQLEKDFNWNRKNKNILFTGLSKKRYFLKGDYCHIPMIEIKPINNWKNFDKYLKIKLICDFIFSKIIAYFVC